MRCYTLLNRIFPKVMTVLLVLTLLMPLVPAAFAAESGTCGEKLEWSFADGRLTITGSGAMTDYCAPEEAPWYSFREEIFWLELPEGLTHVGELAFYDCRNLTAVSIPAAVKTIGDMAFMSCTGLEILRLSEGLESIGENAFDGCAALRDLRLPGTLKYLKEQAFYRCTALSSVEVPRSVTEMGMGVFSYCESLIQAAVLAPLDRLPSWTFYGCTKLTSIDLAEEIKSIGHYSVYDCVSLRVIYYGGEPGDAEELEAQISEDNDYFRKYGGIEEERPEEGESYNGSQEDENGNVTVEDTTVTQTEDSTISTTITDTIVGEEIEEIPVKIVATVITDQGWDELLEAIKKVGKEEEVEADIYIGGDTEVPGTLLEELAGGKIHMTIVDASGEKYTIHFEDLKDVPDADSLDLSYRLKLLEDVQYEALQGAVVYELEFASTSAVPVGVAIQLPLGYVRQTATLYQVKGSKPQYLQSTLVDQKGMSYFYLASVDEGMTYLVGINAPGISADQTNIPDGLKQEYGITEQIQDVDYVITGRKSSWGIGFLEVNQILVGFMLSTAAFVGLAMYARNKRKIRQGFVPGWDDADDGE